MKAIASVLLEPIALLGWLLVVLSWLLWRRPQSRVARWLCVAMTAAFFAVGSPFTANALLGALENEATREARSCPALAPGGVLVVLAGGVSGQPAEADDYARLHEASFRRLAAAVQLAKRVPDSVLVVSGGRGGAVREADLMSAFARDLGLPMARIVAERESLTTLDSARRTALLLQQRGVRGIHLATSALHVPRAVAMFRSAGLSVCPLPVDYRRVHVDWRAALVPQITAVRKSAEALHEVMGYAGYLIFARIGRGAYAPTKADSSSAAA
jgi:uncharacterized SAM-binding protein YcdF (DUF218 family)